MVFGSKFREVKAPDIEMLLAVDVSNSMLDENFEPNRLEGTKYAINELFDREFIKDERSEMVVSKLAKESLMQIADLTIGDYVRVTKLDIGMDKIVRTSTSSAKRRPEKSLQLHSARPGSSRECLNISPPTIGGLNHMQIPEFLLSLYRNLKIYTRRWQDSDIGIYSSYSFQRWYLHPQHGR